MLSSRSIQRTACATCRLRAAIASKQVARSRGIARYITAHNSLAGRLRREDLPTSISQDSRGFKGSAAQLKRQRQGKDVVSKEVDETASSLNGRRVVLQDREHLSLDEAGIENGEQGGDVLAEDFEAPELTDEDYRILSECVDGLEAAVYTKQTVGALVQLLSQYSGDVRVLAVREVFGDVLPRGLLGEDEIALHEELYGETEGITMAEWHEKHEVAAAEEDAEDAASLAEGLEGGELLGKTDARLADDTRGAISDESPEEDEYADSGPDPTVRAHHLTIANRASTSPTTLYLSKLGLVDPVQAIIAGTSPVHLAEAAHRIFGGIGLPYSTSTPGLAKTMQQKPIALESSQGRMTDMEGDAFMAVLIPAMYATITNVLTETRKRLGTAWSENLVRKAEAGQLRILDAGGAGAGVLAVRELLRAEWERMHDENISGSSSMAMAEADGKLGGTALGAPLGSAVVLTGSDALRHRSSSLLENTTFVPRLPDYAHTETAKKSGKFDFVIAPHTLWPIREDYMRRTHVDNIWSLLNADGGVLVMLEKGVPRGFEAIAGARQHLLNFHIASPGSEARSDSIQGPEVEWEGSSSTKEAGMIIAPCTNHASCPMYSGSNKGTVKGRKDVCHFEQRYIRPQFLQRIVNARDKNFEDVKFSYLAVLRGRDLRLPQTSTPNLFAAEPLAVQGQEALDLAAKGYESNRPDSEIAVSSLSLPRQVLPPLKRHGHVTMDLCTPAGTLERWVVPKSFSKQAYRDARKTQWGDLWALGAKTRVERTAKGPGKHARAEKEEVAEVEVDVEGDLLAEAGRVPRKELSKRKIKEKRRVKERKAGRQGVLLGREDFG